MPRNNVRIMLAFVVLLCLARERQQLFAHPGHTEPNSFPLTTWRMASDGRVVHASFYKFDGDRVWLVDEADKILILPLSDLDDEGRQIVNRTTLRLRMLNGQRASSTEENSGAHDSQLLALAPAAKAEAAPAAAKPFQAFKRVKTHWDDKYLYVESDGLPDHPMMKGITNWQQQVPLLQHYTGDNAWRLPLSPVVAKTPAMVKGRFLRGAIALAANGIPIFNPQNNRGEVSQEIGELDEWGGHCGRADDYHYHVTPLHLQSVVGKDQPVAYALDGYPIYGLTEPDGSPVKDLDECHGHTTSIGYHYHASTKYPYVFAGFHGEVVEREGQVDPQPRANPIRPALPPLRGAKITELKSVGPDKSDLTYEINGRSGHVTYALNRDGSFTFAFADPQGQTKEETYKPRDQKGPPPGDDRRPPRDDKPPPRRDDAKLPAEGNPAAKSAPPESAAPANKSGFTLRSPKVKDGGALPVEFTGDGKGSTLPLEWSGAPAGTKSYALIMHHLDPEGKTKWYWTLYNIPADVTHLDQDAQGVGTLGLNSIKDRIGYAPPHSKGPGAKKYVLTLYALSESPKITGPATSVNGEVLSAAIKDLVLASADLNVIYSREGAAPGQGPSEQNPPPRPGEGNGPGGPGRPPRPADDKRPGDPPGGGKPDNKGLIKPQMSDTIKVNIYADNWFVMFINGELVAVDSIKFTPHNVMSIDILPEYPMTIAVMAKDNADPKTGLEYGDHIGDGGFIIKFADGTVSNAKWKAKNFFKGPLNRDTKNPKVEHIPIPDKWWAVDFDDSKWENATEYTEERVGPKEHFYKFDFTGAKFIWTDDLDLDNTVIFRTKVEKPGWKPRWNTKPDLDISGAPFK